MTQSSIRQAVRDHYAERARKSDSCCASDSTSACCETNSDFYPEDLLKNLPEDVSSFSMGCGDPITLAELQPGQSVLDLGSGGGLDCFLSARQVGDSGHVIGVDMTSEMIQKARNNAERLGLNNVDFRQGYLEDLPVDNNSIDVVISNCVINLSPDKSRVFSEIFRVLNSGGRLAVSDIVTEGPLPEAVKRSMSMWAGCVAGAVDAQDYITMMEKAGFSEISVKPTYFDRDTVDQAIREVEDKIDLSSISREELYQTVYSARITARKP